MSSNKSAMRSLWSAARKGELERVRELISDCDPSHSLTKSEEYDVLCIAVERNHTAIAKLLIEKGFQVTSKNKIISGTLLCYAIRNGNIEILGLLLDRGVDINFGTRESVTPFDIAISQKKTKIIELLLHRESCFTDIGKNGGSLLIIAVQSGHLQVVERLLNCGVNVNCKPASLYKGCYTPLCFAVETGNEEIVKLLLSRGANSNVKLKNSKTPLHIAVDRGYIQIVELLLQHGALVNAQDTDKKSSVFYAVINDADSKIIQLLFNNKPDVKDYPDVLNHAIEKENKEMCEALLQLGANVNARNISGITALHVTVLGNKELNKDSDVKGEIVKLLLSRGAKVNAKNKKGTTTLHVAVRKEYVKVVEALLEYNADVNSIDFSHGRTPLHVSAFGSNELICKMLLNKGSNINARDDNGTTPLHIATSYGHDRIVEILLRSGAKPDLKMRDELTPLHVAARHNSVEIVELLLKFGAEIDAVDKCNQTALTVASVLKFTQTSIALLKHGANINILSEIQKQFTCLFDDDEMAKILQHHLVKLKTANLHIMEEYLPSVVVIVNELSDFQHECEKEIADMKREKINNHVSFYDFLTKDISGLARYARNENITQVLTSDDYGTKFPLYANMIEGNVKKGKRRNELLEQGHQIFHFVLNNRFEYPYLCTDKIFSYLSNADLKMLVEACNFNIDYDYVLLFS